VVTEDEPPAVHLARSAPWVAGPPPRTRGRPGMVRVVADPSTADGWQSTMLLAAPRKFRSDRYDGTVALDLPAPDARAAAASTATVIPEYGLTFDVVAPGNIFPINNDFSAHIVIGHRLLACGRLTRQAVFLLVDNSASEATMRRDRPVGPTRTLLGNSSLSRVVTAFACVTVAEWAYVTALAVDAFRRDGAIAISLVGLRLFLAAGASLVSGALVQRQPSGRILSQITIVRAAGLAAARSSPPRARHWRSCCSYWPSTPSFRLSTGRPNQLW
jgi:hypothetical protein